MGSKNLFLKRFEVKYLLNMEQYQAFMEKTEGRFLKDKYFESNISNIYFDTPDFVLIRRSIDKPVPPPIATILAPLLSLLLL